MDLTPERNAVFLGVLVPPHLANELRRRAREDGRSLSAYVRRLLAIALTERPCNSR